MCLVKQRAPLALDFILWFISLLQLEILLFWNSHIYLIGFFFNLVFTTFISWITFIRYATKINLLHTISPFVPKNVHWFCARMLISASNDFKNLFHVLLRDHLLRNSLFDLHHTLVLSMFFHLHYTDKAWCFY